MLGKECCFGVEDVTTEKARRLKRRILTRTEFTDSPSLVLKGERGKATVAACVVRIPGFCEAYSLTFNLYMANYYQNEGSTKGVFYGSCLVERIKVSLHLGSYHFELFYGDLNQEKLFHFSPQIASQLQ